MDSLIFFSWNIIIDPGIGFSKIGNDNYQLIKSAVDFKNDFSNILLYGHSKKRFISKKA